MERSVWVVALVEASEKCGCSEYKQIRKKNKIKGG